MDESARELFGEGNRWMELKRCGKLFERVLKYKTGNTEPEPFYFLAYVSLLHTIKMLQQEQKFNEIEQINLKLDEFIKE